MLGTHHPFAYDVVGRGNVLLNMLEPGTDQYAYLYVYVDWNILLDFFSKINIIYKMYPVIQCCLFQFQIAREHGIPFLETSAKSNVNVERAFFDLAQAILNKVSEHIDLMNIYLKENVTVYLNSRWIISHNLSAIFE